MAALGNGLTYRPPPPRFRADSFIDLGFNTLTFSRDLQDWNNPPGFSSSPPPPLPPPPRAPVLSESGGLLLSPLSAKNLTVKKKKKRGWGGGATFSPSRAFVLRDSPPSVECHFGKRDVCIYVHGDILGMQPANLPPSLRLHPPPLPFQTMGRPSAIFYLTGAQTHCER